MAQHANPNMFHISDPDRAQVITASTVVVRKPLSRSWAPILSNGPSILEGGLTKSKGSDLVT
jgi:hypothetical protein